MKPATLLASVLLIAACGCALQRPAPEPDPFEANRRLGRGINLGNALEAPAEGGWGVTIRDEYFDLIRAAGFDSVRLPVRWSAHADRVAPYTIDPAFLARVDQVIDQALARGLTIIVNVHHYDELMRDPDAETTRFLALWRQLGSHFSSRPDSVLFELLNEPHDLLTPERWNALAAESLAVVREFNPSRTVVIGTASWGGLGALDKLQPSPGDRHLIVSFHYYEPFAFTHQGAEWSQGSEAWLGTRWLGNDAERNAVISDFDRAAAWARERNVPVHLGEFGAYKKADLESRIRWTAFVAREAEKRGFSWAYWEFCSGFGAFDAGASAWRPGLLNALVPAGDSSGLIETRTPGRVGVP